MKEIFVATGNIGKLGEIRLLLQDADFTIFSLEDCPAYPEVIEDGDTFSANAIKKAMAGAVASGKAALADDSGLVIDELGGLPGVRSARFAGEGAGDAANNAKLLSELVKVSAARRSATFVCVVALCIPGGRCITFHGVLNGVILTEPRGTGGFGYDPLFLVPEYGQTLAELPIEVKNRISHRAHAFAQLKAYLEDL